MTTPTPKPDGGAAFKVGDKVKLLRDIFDYGEDHHPPAYCALKDEVVVVRSLLENGRVRSVSHEEVLGNSFQVYDGEYELANAMIEERKK